MVPALETDYVAPDESALLKKMILLRAKVE